MGYSTDFDGSVTVTPPLNQQEIDYINKFSDTRRMNRKEGDYFVEGTGDFGQGNDDDIIDFNSPKGQPGLWCQWIASEDGTEISSGMVPRSFTLLRNGCGTSSTISSVTIRSLSRWTPLGSTSFRATRLTGTFSQLARSKATFGRSRYVVA